jgi:sugar/nucleoside kinase (ribokinase family)
MSIVVTGSIAFDYLMSFPGKFTEQLLPEHVSRVSLSFLVDTMDKRRGGCAPNIAYTLALLRERPRLMATAGQDFDDYRRWLEAAGIDTSLVKQVPDKFTASFFCSTDVDSNQSDRVVLYRRDGECGGAVVPHGDRLSVCDHLAERSWSHAAVCGGVPHHRNSLRMGPGSTVRSDERP